MEKFIIMRFLCLVICCSYSYSYGCNNNPYIKDAGPMVRTSSGSILGKYDKVFDTEVAAFLGIPYAKPPINENRFLKPEPLEHWEGILDATSKPPACMQHSTRNYSWIPDNSTTSEDCLYLNIWSPAKCCCSTTEKLPVMVWIYGGGFYAGSIDMDVYDGSIIASYGKVIVVTINYRLGVFGFLHAGNEKASGNMGLQDQSVGLKWVKNNIEYFGGDPNSITLFGESAGALSVSLHMLSPMSRNLFNRAILMSNTVLNPQLVDGTEVAYLKGNAFAKMVGCIEGETSIQSDPEVVECLKKKDGMELAKAEGLLTSKDLVFFLPSYENEFLPVSPQKSIAEGNIAPVNVLIGNTQDEPNIFFNYLLTPLFPLDSEPTFNLTAAQGIIEALFHTVPKPPSNEIFQQYFKNLTDENSAEILKAISHAFGDYVFNCPVKFFAEKLTNVYMYWYTHKSMRNQLADWVGVTHFDDVFFAFGVPIRDTNNYTPEDGRFSGDLIHKWSNFARTGHPLANNSSEEWPEFSSSHPIAYELNSRTKDLLTFPRTDACEFWRPYLAP